MELNLFPSLADAAFVNINLDSEARLYLSSSPMLKMTNSPSIFLDPIGCEKFINAVTHKEKADYCYGGYLEDRSFLWAGSYLDRAESYLHLGVDFNVPAKTSVAALFDGQVVLVDNDSDSDGGWGPRIVIKPDSLDGEPLPYCLFAHLSEPFVKTGDLIKPGTIIAEVGSAPSNGNWHPHLHLQMVEPVLFNRLTRDEFSLLDGYTNKQELTNLEIWYPNPLCFAWLVGHKFVTAH